MPFYTGGIKLDDFYFTDQNIVDQYASLSGLMWLWGANAYATVSRGSLGDGSYINRSSPVQNVMGGNWKQVSGSAAIISAIRYDSTLWTAGVATSGQLGNNDANYSFTSPVQTVSGGSNWSQVSAGSVMTGATKTDGSLWVWGRNDYGQLGDNTTVWKSSPIQTVAGGTNWKIVSATLYNCSGIKTDGTLWLWGANAYGQLGDNTTVNKSSPIQIMTGGTWIAICHGAYQDTVAAIKTDGTLWTWGYNAFGGLGDNTTIHRSSPVQTIAGGTWRSVDSAPALMTGIKTDGTLWTWGFGGNGQLGDNTTISRSSPAQTVAGGNNWKQVACGYDHMAAIKTDGTLWTWGYNAFGQLGNNTTGNTSSPIQTVMNINTWRQVTCGRNSTSAIQDLG